MWTWARAIDNTHLERGRTMAVKTFVMRELDSRHCCVYGSQRTAGLPLWQRRSAWETACAGGVAVGLGDHLEEKTCSLCLLAGHRWPLP